MGDTFEGDVLKEVKEAALRRERELRIAREDESFMEDTLEALKKVTNLPDQEMARIEEEARKKVLARYPRCRACKGNIPKGSPVCPKCGVQKPLPSRLHLVFLVLLAVAALAGGAWMQFQSKPREEASPAPLPSPAPAPTLATLNVRSIPSEADVFVDGNRVGQTPLRVASLAPGSHYVTVGKAYYASVSEVLETKGAEVVERNITLTRGKGLLRISSSPSGAMIFLNGKYAGDRTPALIPAQAGINQVLLQLDRYHPHTVDVELNDEESKRVEVTLSGGDLVLLNGEWVSPQVVKEKKQQGAQEKLTQARALLAEGRINKAAGKLEEARRLAPSLPEVNALAQEIGEARRKEDAHEGIIAHLQQGELDLAALRLLRPEGNNAREHYQAVLAQDPDNAQAQAGMAKIFDTLVSLTEKSLAAGDMPQAKRHLADAQSLFPDSPQLPPLVEKVNATRQRVSANWQAEKARRQTIQEENKGEEKFWSDALSEGLTSHLQRSRSRTRDEVNALSVKAGQNDPPSQFRLGELYDRKMQDPQKAVYWLRLSAQQGYSPAWSLLEEMADDYDTGNNQRRNLARNALQELRKEREKSR